MKKRIGRAVIVGASSGIGYEVARLLIADGWTLALAARRIEPLEVLKQLAPSRRVFKIRNFFLHVFYSINVITH